MLLRNAKALDRELDWFYAVLDARIRLHFDQESSHRDVFAVEPPLLHDDDTLYSSFVRHYDLSAAERILFVLGLIPHIRPQMLDVLFTKNLDNNREITEFGGRNGASHAGFLPTGETALFVLAGNDLEKRFQYQRLFEADHFFVTHNILTLESVPLHEPRLSGHLVVSREILELVTTGKPYRPPFSSNFPARHIETAMEWEELILDPETMSQVLELKAWIDHGDTLLNDLGLKRKIKPGYRSLFHGPSGTGKTLAATLLGKVTGRDVYRIDLSMIISKYIGETEKNLEKVFSQAEHKDWILFFDEADALFGKRTSVNDAHDRFANQEVSYLLQRIEEYAGVVILASNLRANLDEAFTRRFQSIVHFPMPKPAERQVIWKRGFSPKTPLAADVDLEAIAEKYELSGGAIMNVIRYATLMMLEERQHTIKLASLRDGIRKEFQKEGRSL